MVPHQVSPVKVSAYRPTNEEGQKCEGTFRSVYISLVGMNIPSQDVPDKVDLRKYMTHVEDMGFAWVARSAIRVQACRLSELLRPRGPGSD